MLDSIIAGVTGGVVVGQVASLQETFGTESEWHIALSAYLVLVLICFIPYPWFPESPVYLYVVAGDKEKARRGKFLFVVLEELTISTYNFLFLL